MFSFLLKKISINNIINHMSKLLGSDLDGTLFYPKKRIRMISKRSLKFVRDFIDKGNQFTIVSSRNTTYSFKVAKKINRKVSIVGANGAFIYDDKNLISSKTIDADAGNKVIEFIEQNYKFMTIMVDSSDGEFIYRDKFKNIFVMIGYYFWYFFQGTYRQKFVISKSKFYDAINSGKAYKIMILTGIGKQAKVDAGLITQELRKRYLDIIETNWSNQAIELTAAGCSKSSGLKYLANYLNIDHSDIYVVGDSGNDISMFTEFQQNSFCMSHAPLSVSKHASHVVKHFEEISKYIYERK